EGRRVEPAGAPTRQHAGEAEAPRDQSQEPEIRETGRRPAERSGKREQDARDEGRETPRRHRRAEQTSVAAAEHGVAVHHLTEVAEARVAGADAVVDDEREAAKRHADERRGKREAVEGRAEKTEAY